MAPAEQAAEPLCDTPFDVLEWFGQCLESRAAEMFAGPETYLYFIEDVPSGAIKIGITKRVSGRLRLLQSGTPHELVLLTWATATRAIERLLHGVLLRSRVRGEWFEGNDDVHRVVDEFKEFVALYSAHGSLADFREHFVLSPRIGTVA